MAPIMMFSGYGKTTEVTMNETGHYVVSFFVGGNWTHETVSTNLYEAQRLAEGFVNHVTKPTFLAESA